MNPRLDRLALLAGLVLLTGSLEFCAGLLGPAPAIFAAGILSIAATLIWLRFELSPGRPWLAPTLIAGVVLGCTVLLELLYHPTYAGWFSPILAAGASVITVLLAVRNRARCNLCNRRLRSQAVTFRCPRCALVVCDETCWNFEHRRCELCLEQRVPVLPMEDSWWSRVAGPRSKQGRCQICLASAEQADLRACPNCRRQQCRDCWDFSNGDCGRCGTPLHDLPASLKLVVSEEFTR